jgi:hypothetical protein
LFLIYLKCPKNGPKMKFSQIRRAAAALQHDAAPARSALWSASCARTIDTMHVLLDLLGAQNPIEEYCTPKTGQIFEKSQLSNGSRWLSAHSGEKMRLPWKHKCYVDIDSVK